MIFAPRAALPAPTQPAPLDTPPATLSAEAQAVQDRLNHLFRTSLQRGRIHPLYLPIQKYRQGKLPS